MEVILFGGYIMQSVRNKITAIVIIFSIFNCGSKIFAAMMNRQRLIKESRRNFSSAKTNERRRDEIKKIADRIYNLFDVAKRIQHQISPIPQINRKKATPETALKWFKDEQKAIIDDNTFKFIDTKTRKSFAKAQKIIAQIIRTPKIHFGIIHVGIKDELDELCEKITKKNREANDKIIDLFESLRENSELEIFLEDCQRRLAALKLEIEKLMSRAQAYKFTNYNVKFFIYSVQNIQRAMMKLQNKKDEREKPVSPERNDQKNIGVVRERDKQQKKETDLNRPTKKIKPDETTAQEIHKKIKHELSIAREKLLFFEDNLANYEDNILMMQQRLDKHKLIIETLIEKARTNNFTNYNNLFFIIATNRIQAKITEFQGKV